MHSFDVPEGFERANRDELHPPIELRTASVQVGTVRVLDELEVSFPRGQCSVILGAAGSGKSSLLKLAAGLIVPSGGRVLAWGRDMFSFSARQEQSFRASSGFVFQDSALWQDTTILNNVAMPLRVHRPAIDQKTVYSQVASLLRKLGYTDELSRRPAELSGGEQKLVSIARAIVHQPELLFMDDPVGNLDEDTVERVFAVLTELKDRGTTMIIATNNTELAYQYADCLGVMRQGRLQAFGPYEDALAKVEMVLSGALARLKARGRRGGVQAGIAVKPEVDPVARPVPTALTEGLINPDDAAAMPGNVVLEEEPDHEI